MKFQSTLFRSTLLLLSVILFISNVLTNPVRVKSPEEGDLFEGDIAGIDIEKGAAQIPTRRRLKWPNGIVPYVIDSIYNQSDIDTIMGGLKLVEDSTRFNGKDCIKFVPYTNEKTFIKIISDSGCYSYIGMQSNEGEQILSLQRPGCLVHAIVAHEFIHALGFFHEQSRPDRDDYVKILFENIEEGKENNFFKYNTTQIDYLNVPYDIESVMHYSDKSFSKNGQPTIVSLKEGVIMGQRKQLSPIDIQELRTFYECN